MFETVNLFSSPVHKIWIDPQSFNKVEIVESLKRNYALGDRNNWDPFSNLYHLYQDWDNPKFERIDLSQVQSIYNKIVADFLATQSFKRRFNYHSSITNVTAYDENQFMREHAHIEDDTLYACVHYIQLPKGASPLTFTNPLASMTYNPHPAFDLYQNLYEDNDPRNSTFHGKYSIMLEEDYFYIFPAYLKHQVLPNLKIPSLRMAIVANVKFTGYAD